MQNNRRHHKTRNKNRNHQMSYDSPEGEGEFLNESNDSMLTVSDSLGNMDPADSSLTTEIDRTLLDEFAGDSDLSAEHDFPTGSDTARAGASRQKPNSRSYRRQWKSRAPSASVKASASRVKDRAEPMLAKVQGFVQPLREDMALRLKDAYGAVKVKRQSLDRGIKTQPYLYALGAIVVGFAVARLFTSSSSTRR